MSTTRLKNKIMRSVFYAFAIRVALHPVTLGSAFSLVSLYILAKLVFVARVVEGFLNVPVREIIPHTLGVLSNADLLTLTVFTLCLSSFTYVVLYLMTFKHHTVSQMQIA